MRSFFKWIFTIINAIACGLISFGLIYRLFDLEFEFYCTRFEVYAARAIWLLSALYINLLIFKPSFEVRLKKNIIPSFILLLILIYGIYGNFNWFDKKCDQFSEFSIESNLSLLLVLYFLICEIFVIYKIIKGIKLRVDSDVEKVKNINKSPMKINMKTLLIIVISFFFLTTVFFGVKYFNQKDKYGEMTLELDSTKNKLDIAVQLKNEYKKKWQNANDKYYFAKNVHPLIVQSKTDPTITKIYFVTYFDNNYKINLRLGKVDTNTYDITNIYKRAYGDNNLFRCFEIKNSEIKFPIEGLINIDVYKDKKINRVMSYKLIDSEDRE